MGLLTVKGKKRYALATGKVFIGVCDRKVCRRLIPINELYTVLKWRTTKGIENIARQVPDKILCKQCQNELHPIPDVKKVKLEKGSKKIKTSLRNFFEKFFESTYSTKLLIAKFQRKAKFKKTKKKEFTKALRELKKEKVLQYKNKVWSLKKEIKPVAKSKKKAKK